MDIVNTNLELFKSDRRTDDGRRPTPVERLARALTTTFDAAETEPIRVADPADEEDPK